MNKKLLITAISIFTLSQAQVNEQSNEVTNQVQFSRLNLIPIKYEDLEDLDAQSISLIIYDLCKIDCEKTKRDALEFLFDRLTDLNHLIKSPDQVLEYLKRLDIQFLARRIKEYEQKYDHIIQKEPEISHFNDLDALEKKVNLFCLSINWRTTNWPKDKFKTGYDILLDNAKRLLVLIRINSFYIKYIDTEYFESKEEFLPVIYDFNKIYEIRDYLNTAELESIRKLILTLLEKVGYSLSETKDLSLDFIAQIFSDHFENSKQFVTAKKALENFIEKYKHFTQFNNPEHLTEFLTNFYYFQELYFAQNIKSIQEDTYSFLFYLLRQAGHESLTNKNPLDQIQSFEIIRLSRKFKNCNLRYAFILNNEPDDKKNLSLEILNQEIDRIILLCKDRLACQQPIKSSLEYQFILNKFKKLKTLISG